MIKSFIAGFFLVVSLPLVAQKSLKEIVKSVDTMEIGTSYVTNRPVKAVCYTVKDELGKIDVDSAGNILVVKSGKSTFSSGNQFRTTGFQLDGMRALWQSERVNGTIGFTLRDHVLLQFEGDLTARDVNTYEKKWQAKAEAYLWNAEFKELLVKGDLNPRSLFSAPSGPNFYCLNPQTGKDLWGSTIDFSDGLLSYNRIDDSVFVLVGDGLKCYHSRKGMLWSSNRNYEASAFDFEPPISKGTLIRNESYIFEALWGYGFDDYWNLTSNIVSDSMCLYSVHSVGLDCLNKKNGFQDWTYAMENPEPSHSTLILADSLLIHIDEGWGNWRDSRVFYGRPCWRVLDKRSGKLLFRKKLEGEGNFVNDVFYSKKDTTLYLILPNRVEMFNALTGTLRKSVVIDKLASRGDFFFSGLLFWEKTNEELYKPIWNSSKRNIIVGTRNLILVEYDRELNFIRYIRKNEIFYPFYTGGLDKIGLYNNQEVVIADSSGRALVRLNHKADEVFVTAGFVVLKCEKENQFIVLRREDVLN